MSDHTDVLDALGMARLAASHAWPWWTEALYRLTWIPRDGVGTLGVDQWWRCYVDPAFARATKPEHLAGALAHEVQHLVRGHHRRQVGNVAGDLAINDEPALWRTLPPCALHPSQFKFDVGLTEEEYEQLLAQQSTGHSGDDSSDGTKREASTADTPGAHIAAGDCGSCADGQPRSWEDAPLDDGGIGEFEERTIARRAAEKVVECARSRGDVPGELVEWAQAVLAGPSADWRRVFRAALQVAVDQQRGHDDYSWRRPARRPSLDGGLLRPTTVATVVPVAAIDDTSGSMSDDMVAAGLVQCWHVGRAAGQVEVPVVLCDAEAYRVDRVRGPRDAARVARKGMQRGGTDMRTGIARALRLRPRPAVVAVMTDGGTPWPDRPPRRCKIVCGWIGGTFGQRPADAPEWLRVVSVPIAQSRQ